MRCADIGHITDGRAGDHAKLCDLSGFHASPFHDADFRLFSSLESVMERRSHGKKFFCVAELNENERQERRRHVFRRCFPLEPVMPITGTWACCD